MTVRTSRSTANVTVADVLVGNNGVVIHVRAPRDAAPRVLTRACNPSGTMPAPQKSLPSCMARFSPSTLADPDPQVINGVLLPANAVLPPPPPPPPSGSALAAAPSLVTLASALFAAMALLSFNKL